jgi:small subunit ribosomal protein S16
MLAIRFNRVGKKNKAYFRVVLQEHTIAPGGKHVEILGSYDPHLKKAVLKAEKIKEWIKKGAQASDSAWNLFVKEGIVEGKKRAVKIPKKAAPEVSAEEVKEAPKEEKKETKKETAPAEVKPEEEIKSKPAEAKPKEEKVKPEKIEKEAKAEELKPEKAKKEETVDKK